jgi:hypothetical protein
VIKICVHQIYLVGEDRFNCHFKSTVDRTMICPYSVDDIKLIRPLRKSFRLTSSCYGQCKEWVIRDKDIIEIVKRKVSVLRHYF